LKIEDRVMAGKFLIDSGKVKIKPELPLWNALNNATRDENGKERDRVRKDIGDMHSIDAFEYTFLNKIRYLRIPASLIKKGDKDE
jgi:hypothetical protein